jgi:hypothetical protein
MAEVTSKLIGILCSKELLTDAEEKEMPQQPFGKIFVGTAVLLLLATSLCSPINVHARRRAKRKLPAVQKATVALTEKGYEPTGVKLRRGVPAKITFIGRFLLLAVLRS